MRAAHYFGDLHNSYYSLQLKILLQHSADSPYAVIAFINIYFAGEGVYVAAPIVARYCLGDIPNSA